MMEPRKMRVRVLSKGGAGRAEPAGGSGRLTAAPPRPAARPGKPPEARFRPSDGIEVVVQFRPDACTALLEHCGQSNQHGQEICGLLLGAALGPTPQSGRPQEYQLVVTDILPLESSDASGAHVSADPDAWARAEAEIEARFPGKERLGWYHTHPTQGIFFSGQDKNFHSVFTRPFQFALVVNPRSREVGLFYWHDRIASQIDGPVPLDLRPRPGVRTAPSPGSPGIGWSGHRLALLLLGLAGTFWLVTKAGPRTGPLAFPMSLFVAALLLRLWNAAVAPLPRAEVRVNHPAERSGGFHGGFAVVALALGALLVAVFLPGRFPGFHGTAEKQVRPAAQLSSGSPAAPAQVVASPAKRMNPPPAAEVTVEVVDGADFLLFLWQADGSRQRVEYHREQGNYSVTAGQERALTSYLLGVSALRTEDLKQLQRALGIKDDGDWGGSSRRALLEAALSGSSLQVSSEGKPRSITFRRLWG